MFQRSSELHVLWIKHNRIFNRETGTRGGRSAEMFLNLWHQTWSTRNGTLCFCSWSVWLTSCACSYSSVMRDQGKMGRWSSHTWEHSICSSNLLLNSWLGEQMSEDRAFLQVNVKRGKRRAWKDNQHFWHWQMLAVFNLCYIEYDLTAYLENDREIVSTVGFIKDCQLFALVPAKPLLKQILKAKTFALFLPYNVRSTILILCYCLREPRLVSSDWICYFGLATL